LGVTAQNTIVASTNTAVSKESQKTAPVVKEESLQMKELSLILVKFPKGNL
jgi:hypothetical protein